MQGSGDFGLIAGKPDSSVQLLHSAVYGSVMWCSAFQCIGIHYRSLQCIAVSLVKTAFKWPLYCALSARFHYVGMTLLTIAQAKGIVSFPEAYEISIGPKQSDYTVSVLWQEEGYTVKYSLKKREIQRPEPKKLPEGSGYISPCILIWVIIQTFSISRNYTSSIVLPVRAILKELILCIGLVARAIFSDISQKMKQYGSV